MAPIHLPLMLWRLIMNTTSTSQMAAIIWMHNKMCWWIAPALAILILYDNGRSAEETVHVKVFQKFVCQIWQYMQQDLWCVTALMCLAVYLAMQHRLLLYQIHVSMNTWLFQQHFPKMQENSRWLWMEMPQPMLRSCKDRKWSCFALLTIPMNCEQTFLGIWKYCLGLLLLQYSKCDWKLLLQNFWLVWPLQQNNHSRCFVSWSRISM